jgi:hypothetical protein
VNPFAYVRARDMQTALAVNARTPGARYVAGGTNILDLMKDDVERPALLVDINGIGYDRIDARDDGIFIGALVRMTDVARHPAIRERFAAVAMALDETASPQCETWGPSAATFFSGRVVRIFATRRCRVTSVAPEVAVRPSAARIAASPFSGQANVASPPTPQI